METPQLSSMTLRLMTPNEVLLETSVSKVIAEGPEGSFCLLPRHIDFVSLLTPGLLLYEDDEGTESFVALDDGVMVKCGDEVLVSALNAVTGPDLGDLRRIVAEQFRALDERERAVRTSLAKLETDFVRRFLELGGFDDIE